MANDVSEEERWPVVAAKGKRKAASRAIIEAASTREKREECRKVETR